ncbi:MAG: FtsX-like permease family protein, partial [Alphaproteobacteria bacterium]
KLGVDAGDTVTLVSPQTTPTVFGAVPRQKRYRVVATFEIGMFDYDDSFIFMPLEAADLFFRLRGGVTGLEVVLHDPEAVDAARAAIAAVVGPRLRLRDWRDVYAPFLNQVRVQRNVLILLLALVILVAAFNIISGLNMLVKDKRGEIGILRTMGATRGMIMRIFLLNSLAVGLAGAAAGVALAVVFAEHIETIRRWLEALVGVDLFSPELYLLAELPARIQPADAAWVAAMALGASLIATLYPSWRAASLDPVETLRYG